MDSETANLLQFCGIIWNPKMIALIHNYIIMTDIREINAISKLEYNTHLPSDAILIQKISPEYHKEVIVVYHLLQIFYSFVFAHNNIFLYKFKVPIIHLKNTSVVSPRYRIASIDIDDLLNTLRTASHRKTCRLF